MHLRHVDDVDEFSVEHSAIEHGDAVSSRDLRIANLVVRRIG